MSDLLFNNAAQPSTPAAGKTLAWVDSADRYLKTLDEKGIVGVVGDHELKNLVRNSGFWFAQRQVPGTATTYSSVGGRVLTADGWSVNNENASMTYERADVGAAPEAGLPQSRFYGSFVKITSSGKLAALQVVENRDVVNLRGRRVRVQCWMKQVVAAAPVVRLGLIQLTSAGTADTVPSGASTFFTAYGAAGTDPTLGTNLAYVAPVAGKSADGGTINGNAVDCTLGASWTRFGAVFDVPAGCQNLIVAVWSNGQLAATNGFALAQVSLTDGEEVQNWSPHPIQMELARVQRYYQKTFLVDTGPVQAAGLGSGEHRFVNPIAGAVAGHAWYQFEVRMRVNPTMTGYNPFSANAFVRNITKGTDATATAFTVTSERGGRIGPTGLAAWVIGDELALHMTMDAEL